MFPWTLWPYIIQFSIITEQDFAFHAILQGKIPTTTGKTFQIFLNTALKELTHLFPPQTWDHLVNYQACFMCIFKVENKRSGRKKNLVMHKMFCWKQKVVFSFKTNLDFNLYSTAPAWTQIIVLCSDRLGERQSSSHNQRQRRFWCNTWSPSTQGLGMAMLRARSQAPSSAPSEQWCFPKAWES